MDQVVKGRIVKGLIALAVAVAAGLVLMIFKAITEPRDRPDIEKIVGQVVTEQIDELWASGKLASDPAAGGELNLPFFLLAQSLTSASTSDVILLRPADAAIREVAEGVVQKHIAPLLRQLEENRASQLAQPTLDAAVIERLAVLETSLLQLQEDLRNLRQSRLTKWDVFITVSLIISLLVTVIGVITVITKSASRRPKGAED